MSDTPADIAPLTAAIIYITLVFAFVGIIIPGFAPNAADILPGHGAVLYNFSCCNGIIVRQYCHRPDRCGPG